MEALNRDGNGREVTSPAGDPATRGFLIESSPGRCLACWACVRACPARAIRVVDHRAEIVEDRCIECGACVGVCGRDGHVVRDDLPHVRDLLASGRPVVALLATEFVAAMHPATPAEVERALERAGFYAVETTLLGEELVALSYEHAHARATAPVVLRSTCPVAVSWVRRFRPSLVGALAPIIPPYIAQARLVRALYPADVAIVYVSPCYARKDEIADPQLAGAVDVAIDFEELKALIGSAATPMAAVPPPCSGSRRPAPVKELSLTDGYPRRTLVEHDMTSQDVVAVRGVKAIDDLLGAVERGEVGPLVVDMLYCDGCVDGPATGSELSVFAKRTVLANAGRATPRTTVDTRKLLAHLPAVETVRSFTASPALMRVFDDAQIDACLAEGEFESRDVLLDCGACGYETCVEHAVAVLDHDSTWDMCFPLQRKRLERTNEALERSATLDSLTGLWNRRVFSERLEAEVARNARYGTDVTLLMIDLDAFKEVNDGYGHTVGDAVLGEVARIMRDTVRETDVPARYGGDEFALILPGIGKTAGYAVAEKLRALIAAAAVPTDGARGGDTVSTTVSVGLASAGGSTTSASSLVEAADRALYRAKAHGRDQVRIAPD